MDAEAPGVVVFSYPRYCRYRALVARLEGIQADWLRDSLVAALGGYAAPTMNTRILYCKDTFEYPELEGHEFVCNHLAPKLKGRPRGRRRTRARSRDRDVDADRDSRSSDSDVTLPPEPRTPKRITLRNGNQKSDEEDAQRTEDESERRKEESVREETKTEESGREESRKEEKKKEESGNEEVRKVESRKQDSRKEGNRREISSEDEAFLQKLREFYNEADMKISHTKNISLRELYNRVKLSGGYEATCRARLWKSLYGDKASRANRLYERIQPKNGLEKSVVLTPRASPNSSPKPTSEENGILGVTPEGRESKDNREAGRDADRRNC
ncbi:unnamed protein product [Leptidea sinapis]|uniref:ARID domain-containing protein n=1 Tax=Leptidea sinapis TaxID=189913 RepID=A0A5E4R3X6_9NEOP|nr:unnamed protein product [Leptidea sinapis]